VLQYNFFKSFYQKYQSDEDKDVIAMYKDQVEFLKSIIKEKEEMYRILVKVIDKKK